MLYANPLNCWEVLEIRLSAAKLYIFVNKYDFNFIMNKKKAKDKYEGRSINELAYKSYESLTDDSFPYPEAKAYFIFLTYLYSTMAEKHKLFK